MFSYFGRDTRKIYKICIDQFSGNKARDLAGAQARAAPAGPRLSRK